MVVRSLARPLQFRLRRRLAQPARVSWSPLDFGADLLAWFDASDTSTITETGGAVSAWADKSGNGWDVSQATGASQPTTGSATLNGRNVVSFDGTDDFLTASSISPAIAFDDFSCAVVLRSGSDVSLFQSAVRVQVSGTGFFVAPYGRGGSYPRVAVTDTFTSLNTSATGNYIDPVAGQSYTLLSSLSDGAQLLRVDGQDHLITTDAAGTAGSQTGIRLGADSGGADPFDGDIAEVILVRRALTDAEIAQVESYLDRRWGGRLFDPTSLGSDLLAWWDASDPRTITETGGSVSAWASRVGSVTATQATGAAQPATGGDIGGRPALTFDGTDDTLEHSGLGLVDVFAVIHATEAVGTQGVFASTELMLLHALSGSWGTFSAPDGNQLADSDAPLAASILSMVGGEPGVFYRDGQPDGAYTTTQNQNPNHIGGLVSGSSQAFPGDIAEIICTTAGSGHENKIHAYLSEKYGIALGLDVTWGGEPLTWGGASIKWGAAA